MAPHPGCVVGVDGLPLGTSAVVAIDGAVVGRLLLTTDGGRPLDLETRIDEAIRGAAELAGRSVGEVRLAIVDDGTTGERMNALDARLAAVGRRLVVIHLTGGSTETVVRSPSGIDAPSTADDRSRGAASAARAELAALAPERDGGS